MRGFVIAAVAALALSGCVSLGLSQADSEAAYTAAAIASNAFLISGKATTDAKTQLCAVDVENYGILVSTRNVADGVAYGPADTAHGALQASCVR